MKTLKFKILGSIPSGKNSVIVTRTGKRFPSKRFVEWRAKAVDQLSAQLPKDFAAIKGTCSVKLYYWAPDLRKRDVPGIIDSIWHVLERLEIIENDYLFGGIDGRVDYEACGVDRKNPRVELVLVYWE